MQWCSSGNDTSPPKLQDRVLCQKLGIASPYFLVCIGELRITCEQIYVHHELKYVSDTSCMWVFREDLFSTIT